MIDLYVPTFRRAQKVLRAVRASQKKATLTIARQDDANLLQWDRAVIAARRFFRSEQFQRDWTQSWGPGATKIRRALHGPRFSFSRQDWEAFYDEWAFGHLIPIFRDRAFRKVSRIQAGFRQLFDGSRRIQDRLDAVLDKDGKFHVPSVGLNVISKVLAVSEPLKWPVYNRAVAQALSKFGYRPPRGASRAAKYLAFANLMDRFRREAGAPSMLALDPFFYRIAVKELKASSTT